MFIPTIKKSLKPGYLSFIYEMTYFDLMKLPIRYDIDKKILSLNYNEIKPVLKTPFVNEAFFTLNDDIKRASYMLKLKGVKPDHVDYQITDEMKKELSNTYILPALKEDINIQIESVKNDFADSIDYDELSNAKYYYTILYKLVRLEKEIYERINE
jgi:hypothetical protein